MKDIQKIRFNDLHRNTIVQYLEAGGDGNDQNIILSDKQKEFFERWRYADELIRQNKNKREEIANFIKVKFGVSRDTAFRDIVNAEYVFASSYPLNKAHIIGRRMEFLEKCIWDAKIDKNWIAVEGLEKRYQEYLKIYPAITQKRSPRTIIFHMNQNILNINTTVDQASQDADEIIKRIESNDDY